MKPLNKTLYVIAPLSNPVRYHSRYRLYQQFEKHMLSFPNLKLITSEVAFGDRPFETEYHPNHIHLRTDHEIWHKENSINIAISRLPHDWEYLAWVDADLQFINLNWVEETIHQLQHYAIVQLFQDAIDLGPKNNFLRKHTSFGYQYVSNASYGPNYTFWHPGFAWAATKTAINQMGGLIDWAILGAADHHMALAWIGQAYKSVPKNISKGYLEELLTYQKRCETNIKRNIGFVEGTILHAFHGKTVDRRYVERWDIITQNNFDPRLHLKRDSQGLFQLDHSIKIRDEIRTYMRGRNEDSIDE